MSPATLPAMRFYASFDYDSARGMIVMFGGGEGKDIGDIYLQDTWGVQVGTEPRPRQGRTGLSTSGGVYQRRL